MDTAISYIQDSKKYTRQQQRKAITGAVVDNHMRHIEWFYELDILPEQMLQYVIAEHVDCIIVMTEDALGSNETEIVASYEALLTSGTDVLVIAD